MVDIKSVIEKIQDISGTLNLEKDNLPAIELMYAATERSHILAQALQDQWKTTLGLDVKLRAVEAQVSFSEIQSGNYQMAIGSWIADFADPVNFLEVLRRHSRNHQ